MKVFSFILALTLVIGSKAQANQCGSLFKKDGGEVLADVFNLILNAPNNSKVTINTNRMVYDGIGSLMLLVSVVESSKARGLKFDFNIADGSSAPGVFVAGKKFTTIYDLLTERSTNRVRFRDMMAEPLEKVTTVTIESSEGVVTYKFDGELNSSSLKNASLKRGIQVNYAGRNRLRASPFTPVDGVTLSQSSSKSSVAKNEDSYVVEYKSRITMTESDMNMFMEKANDLALQLYIHKKRQAPKEKMDTLALLEAALN